MDSKFLNLKSQSNCKFNHQSVKKESFSNVRLTMDTFHHNKPKMDYQKITTKLNMNLNSSGKQSNTHHLKQSNKDLKIQQNNGSVKSAAKCPEQFTSQKSKKVCEVQQILEKFHKKHPEYAALDAFNGVKTNEIVSYNSIGEPMNAIENFWFLSQGGHSRPNQQKLNLLSQNHVTNNPIVIKDKPVKECEVQQILDKFDSDNPELAKYQLSFSNQIVSCNAAGTPLNAIEDFWLTSQGNPSAKPNPEISKYLDSIKSQNEKSSSDLNDSGFENGNDSAFLIDEIENMLQESCNL